MGWVPRFNASRIWLPAFLFSLFILFFTPTIPRSHNHHHFVDMRNLLASRSFAGVPNTINVITNFPFLVVGVLGFVLALDGAVFYISSQGEVYAWVVFYAGMVGVAFGSAYYHLKPDNHRVLWDTLPMMVAFSSLFSALVVERFGQRIGLFCLFALIFAAVLCVVYERNYNDIRFCMIFQLTLPLAIPVIAFMYSSKYTHSRYWFLATGIYLLAKFEGATDKKLYHANNYIISGHSLEHLCLSLIPIVLSIMLIYRESKFQRLVDLKDRHQRGGVNDDFSTELYMAETLQHTEQVKTN
ncbi:hypothetical protein Ahy_A07g033221 [Arachis hypogaea]|uniref:Ceramidase n=1 Tax=Arachis hypogaea TaxID=3818 RepID=A0A445C8L6_ARAHY|nr:hypothetical protein Ahy_A07g033221 [Arachis hypogaea]